MSFPYRIRNPRYCFNPESKERFRVSRSKIDLFIQCKRCFYLDQRHGVARTSLPAFSLNNAVDLLLKKEFDAHREKGTWHPTLKHLGVKLKPFQHEKMEEWRDAMRHGVQYDLPDTSLTIRGGVDDIWVDKDDVLYVVDYKSTAKENDDDVTLDGFWQEAYKRQVEVYQWLLRKNGFAVSDTAYFYYVNGQLGAESFSGKLQFNVKLIPHEGDDSWVDEVLVDLNQCLLGGVIPEANPDCEHCGYVNAIADVLKSQNEGSSGPKKTKKSATDTKDLF